jgi:hypothetical protein
MWPRKKDSNVYLTPERPDTCIYTVGSRPDGGVSLRIVVEGDGVATVNMNELACRQLIRQLQAALPR